MSLPSILPGLAVTASIALLASLLGEAFKVVGAPVFGLAIGVVVRMLRPPAVITAGAGFAARNVLQLAIVISGLGISLAAVARTSAATLPVMLGTIAIAIFLAPLCGRLFGIGKTLQSLIGIGTAICGASAIAALSCVVDASELDMTLAMATIFLYNVAAVLCFPPLGHLMHLSQSAFGVWAGTAVNDTSSVLAAGYAYGNAAGAHATIVKLGRALMILPVVAGVAFIRVWKERRCGAGVPWRAIVPWFVLWFLLATLAAGFVPEAWHATIAGTAAFLITMALAGVGLQTNLRSVRAAGPAPLLLGFLLWMSVAVASLILQRLTGT